MYVASLSAPVYIPPLALLDQVFPKSLSLLTLVLNQERDNCKASNPSEYVFQIMAHRTTNNKKG